MVVGWFVGWLLVGWLLVVGRWLGGLGWLVGLLLVGGWFLVGRLVGWWLVVVSVGLLLVLGGWWVGFGLQNWSELLGTTPSNLERRWLGAGGGMLWLCWWAGVSDVGSLERKLRKTICFSRFLGGQADREPTPPLFTTLASGPVFFKVLVLKP